MNAVGFSGTQKGLTNEQKQNIGILLRKFREGELNPSFHFGWCVGADDEAAMIAGNLGYTLVAHPGPDPDRRGTIKPHVVLAVKPFLTRNRDIVRSSSVIVAGPRLTAEELRSGTWATVRYARDLRRGVWIVWPTGTIEQEVGR